MLYKKVFLGENKTKKTWFSDMAKIPKIDEKYEIVLQKKF